MKNILVKQKDIKDCGVCCLLSIIKYYDGEVPIETLRLDTKTSTNGVTALNLIKTAKKYGFDSYGMKLDDLEIKSELLPVIAHTNQKGYNHFVVVYKIKNNTVYVMDPAKGYKKYNIDEFKNIWTNIILLFKPYQKIPQIKNKHSIKTTLFKFIQINSLLIYKIILFNIIITILSIILSYYFKISIDSLETNYINTTIFIVIIFLILNVIKIYISHIKNKISIYFNKNIDLTLIPDFIYHIFNLPLNVIKSRTSGEIITRVSEINNIKSLFSEIIITILLDLTLAICSIFFLYNISKELFLILCIISLLYIVVGLIISPIIIRKINDNIELETEFNSELVEKIDSIETIKNLNITNKIVDNITKKYTSYLSNTFDYNLFINNQNTIKTIINEIGLFIISSYGIYLISKGNLTIISLVTFNSLLSYYINPIENIINLIPNYLFIKLTIGKINEFLNIEPEHNGEQEDFSTGDICIKNIKYSYDNYNYVLNEYNLEIKENTHLCIGGESGCGKSTLCRLLSRNIDDYNGNIYINDINIKDYSLNTIRRNILYVSQREKLFTGSIRDNILINKEIDIKELNYILKITKVDEILNKKSLRLESLLIDGGYNLSGGERQRIILARALVQKPKILILDESLSEMNPDMEKEILGNIDMYLKKTTLIYVSHSSVNYLKDRIEMSKI